MLHRHVFRINFNTKDPQRETEQLRMESKSISNTPSLTVPSTQNTAPVHCFRCLYTYDLRRKAKRWQDGALRYHTFNKRIMVYDISRNFIGDTHWRDGGGIEDGDELELDKGVLIQVGEKTESVDQDLTSLFEKRRKNHTNSGENSSSVLPDSAPVRQPVPSSPSQLRPKSLNAILGTPSGSLGRAARPLISPCDLRRQNENDMDMQRGTKRRRVENPSKIPPNMMEDAVVTSRTSHTEQDAVPGKVQTTKGQNLVGQSSSFNPPATKGLHTAITMAIKTTRQASNEVITDGHVGNEDVGLVPCHNYASPRAPKVLGKPPGHVISTGLEKTQDLQEHDALPMKRLQILSRKPRKKLIYQDLLPPVAPANPLPQQPGRASTNAKSSRKRSEKSDPQAEFHRAQKERLESRLRKHHRREINSSRHDGILDSITISDVEDDILPSASDRNTINTTTENFPSISPLKPSLSEDNHPKTKPHRQAGWEPPPSSIIVPKLKPSSPPNFDLADMDQILLTQFSNDFPSQVSNLLPRKPSTTSPKSSISKQSRESPLAAASLISSKPTTTKPHKRSPMRKTVSEPIGRLSTCRANVTAVEQIPDPWSREAWDLFGYGRPTRAEKGNG